MVLECIAEDDISYSHEMYRKVFISRPAVLFKLLGVGHQISQLSVQY